jgi:hypothetical protein
VKQDNFSFSIFGFINCWLHLHVICLTSFNAVESIKKCTTCSWSPEQWMPFSWSSSCWSLLSRQTHRCPAGPRMDSLSTGKESIFLPCFRCVGYARGFSFLELSGWLKRTMFSRRMDGSLLLGAGLIGSLVRVFHASVMTNPSVFSFILFTCRPSISRPI